MLSIRTFVAASTACLLAATFDPVPASAEDEPGKLNIKVTGPDGKRVEDPYIIQTEMGAKPNILGGRTGDAGPGKGKVIEVDATDNQGNYRQTVVYVPDGTQVDLVMPIEPMVLPDDGYAAAKDAQKTSNTQGYEEAYNALKTSRDQMQRVANEAQGAIDQWAEANGVPKGSLKDVDKKLKTAEKLGKTGTTDAEAIEMLKAYKAKLEDMETYRKAVAAYDNAIGKLTPPDKISMVLPGACPEGESGGLLAGLLNSATGTNSFSGVCGDPEKQRKNKNRQGGGDRDHERED